MEGPKLLKMKLNLIKQIKNKPNTPFGMSGRTRTQGATQAPHQTLVHVKLDQIEGSNQSQIEIQARIHEHQVERITRYVKL